MIEEKPKPIDAWGVVPDDIKWVYLFDDKAKAEEYHRDFTIKCRLVHLVEAEE